MVFAANVDAAGMSDAACGARLRASAGGGCGPHGSKSRTTAMMKSFARAGAPRIQTLCHFSSLCSSE